MTTQKKQVWTGVVSIVAIAVTVVIYLLNKSEERGAISTKATTTDDALKEYKLENNKRSDKIEQVLYDFAKEQRARDQVINDNFIKMQDKYIDKIKK